MRKEQVMERWRQLVTRERPFGIGFVADASLVEVEDPRNDEATLARWQPVLDRLGIPVVGVRDIPAQPVRFEVRGIEWELTRMETDGRNYAVPQRVLQRIRAAEAAEVPFAYWLWGEE